jgi:hypothetical protein
MIYQFAQRPQGVVLIGRSRALLGYISSELQKKKFGWKRKVLLHVLQA